MNYGKKTQQILLVFDFFFFSQEVNGYDKSTVLLQPGAIVFKKNHDGCINSSNWTILTTLVLKIKNRLILWSHCSLIGEAWIKLNWENDHWSLLWLEGKSIVLFFFFFEPVQTQVTKLWASNRIENPSEHFGDSNSNRLISNSCIRVRCYL